jgi:hypothetical protein
MLSRLTDYRAVRLGIGFRDHHIQFEYYLISNAHTPEGESFLERWADIGIRDPSFPISSDSGST